MIFSGTADYLIVLQNYAQGPGPHNGPRTLYAQNANQSALGSLCPLKTMPLEHYAPMPREYRNPQHVTPKTLSLWNMMEVGNG